MADIKISQMEPWVGPLTGNEEFPVVTANAQNTNFRVALSQITPSTLGFGSMALQNANAVQITGGNVAVTTLSGAITIANGGTGLSATPTAGQLLIGDGAGYTLATLTAGSGVSIVNSAGGIQISATGTGSVTSVGLDGGTTGITISGVNPITTSGTFTLGGVLNIANGGTGATTANGARIAFGAAKSGANSDITSLSGLTTPLSADQGGTGAAGSLSGYVVANGSSAYTSVATIPATDISGILAIGNGGTGASTAANARVNLLPSYTGNAGKALFLNAGATDVQWQSVAGSGTVTSIDVSGGTTGLTTTGGPVTTTGTITFGGTLITTNGGTGLSSYTAGDLLYYASGTALSKLTIGAANRILTSSGSSPQWTTPSSISVGTASNLAGGEADRIAYQTGSGTTGFITAPTVADTYLNWSGTAFQWSANPLGTVTSVSGTGTVNGLTLTGTVTTSGSLTLGGTLSGISLTTQVTGTLPVANGGTGAVTLTGYVKGSGTSALTASATIPASDISSGAALTKSDDTNVTLTLGGSPTAALLAATSLTLGWTGQLAISRGGTNGTDTPTAGAVAYGTGTAYAFTTAGTAGQVLLSNGSSAPSFGGIDGGTF